MRDNERQAFIAQNGWGDAAITPLPGDASRRRYFRLTQPSGETRLLMDMPRHPEEKFDEFVLLANHIRSVGLSAPEVFAADAELGLALIEDFGNDTFTQLLNAGAAPEPLYKTAISAMAALQTRTPAASLPLKHYDTAAMVGEFGWFLEWYAPMLWGRMPTDEQRAEFHGILSGLFNALPPLPTTLLMRDFHVDNFMWLPERDGVQACGLLDFQDAKWGSPAYDLVSVLEDARRDMDPMLSQQLYHEYLLLRPDLDEDDFAQHYAAMGLLRHGRILGNFIRLWVRDDKAWYLQFMPRVTGQFIRKLTESVAAPLKQWCDRNLPDLESVDVTRYDAGELKKIMAA